MAIDNSRAGRSWEVKDYGAAQNDVEVIAAPGAGKAIEILGATVSSDAVNSAFLEHGATLVAKAYLAAGGTAVLISQSSQVLVPENTALTLTSTAAANLTIAILYRIVKVL